ncbi:transcription factor EMB1444-like [Rhododendron vialii]|uniref:transcription factor EMB1444-like n=1 Tax=Rhododendron vialii TaxID=182163 RepID=UPI00266026BB|nr:transcription factor EMB1444-like [Rhododendron vialii]
MAQPTCDKSYDQSFVEKDTLHSLGSKSCGVSSSMGFSSRSHSAFSEQLNSAQEPAKGNKKRARPGENGGPKPRDRQLIQDRIKELREIVPSGSTCSIDLHLERTIKHMLFMQSIIKHADTLSKCVESKLHYKRTSLGGLPGYDQGSSWAMEVGSHLKVCPIMVENINVNGQMLIEMLCEESGHFLEIAEAVRSIGLAILKGVVEAFGKTTRMSFVVEGQNNRSMHRMDVLWSLVQILQPKTMVWQL